MFFTRENDRRATMRDSNGRLEIRIEKQFLHRDRIRTKRSNKLGDIVINLRQPQSKPHPSRSCNNAEAPRLLDAAVPADYPEPDSSDTRIDPKNYQTMTNPFKVMPQPANC